MALYDDVIKRLAHRARHPEPGNVDGFPSAHDWETAQRIIGHLQSIVRDYNPDDAIFDDEKRPRTPDADLPSLDDVRGILA